MFPPVYVADVSRHEGQEVTLHGWLHGRRSSGKLHFLQLRDGTGTIQCVVFKGNVTPEVFHEADHLPQETSLTVTGLLEGGYTLLALSLLRKANLRGIDRPTT